ncbi:MAG: hypothetical protein PVJ20_04315, partial [Desulfobacterales bacterium]
TGAQSLRLPREMFTPLNVQPIQRGQSLFFWGQSSESLVPASVRDAVFLDCLDLAKNCSFPHWKLNLCPI